MPNTTKKPYKKTNRKRNTTKKYSNIVSKIRKEIALDKKKHVETKQSNYSSSDGVEIFHNNFIVLDNHLLKTTQGITDPNALDTANRIGDKISVKGVSIKMMIELNSRYSDATYRLLIVRSAKGDTPTTASLFNGLSANKMLDTLNTERYSIVYQKFYKLRAPNEGISNASGTQANVGTIAPISYAGIEYVGNSDARVISRATKICKIWIPGKRFARNGVITYENGASQVKFFDYHVMMYAYSNYGTYSDWHVARVNDYIMTMYFTDQ